jgi:hypothetical protein
MLEMHDGRAFPVRGILEFKDTLVGGRKAMNIGYVDVGLFVETGSMSHNGIDNGLRSGV